MATALATRRPRKAPTDEQRAAAQARRERFNELARRVAAMSEDQRAALVNRAGGIFTCEGRTLSMFNSCLIMSQDANASQVGGFWQWQKAGRRVNKGAVGLCLWIPTAAKGNAGPTDGTEAQGDGTTGPKSRARFVMGTVFDISQTRPMNEPAPAALAAHDDQGDDAAE